MTPIAMLNKSYPSFEEWRRFSGDPTMAPDKGFAKQLAKIDKDLKVIWDWGSEKWEIWRIRTDMDPQHITTIQTKGKSYRELGADVLLRLKESYWYMNNLSVKQVCDYLDELDNQVLRRRKEEFMTKIHDITHETFDFIHTLHIQVPQKYKVRRIVSNASASD